MYIESKVLKKIFIIIYFFSLILILYLSSRFFENFLANNRIVTENSESFLLPPNKKIKYITHEFNIIVSTNKFGFRGNEEVLKENQIIVIGDSMTYGWGLNNNQTWPFLLNFKIEQNNKNFKVYNLGVPGTHTNNHIATAKEYIRKIKPKIVIIAIGISDDFQQVLEAEERQILEAEERYNKIEIPKAIENSKKNNFKMIIKDFYPNSYLLLKSVKNYDYNQIFNGYLVATKDWKNIYKEKLKKNYPADIIELMKKGFINPGIFQYANSYPYRNLKFYKNISINNSHESEIFKNISQNFKDLKKIADNNNTKLILLSIPSGSYVDSLNFENSKKFGFMLSNEDLETFLPEEILEKMSDEISINFIKTLRLFRDLKRETFFPYDGHFNSEGAKFMSEIIYKYLEKNFF